MAPLNKFRYFFWPIHIGRETTHPKRKGVQLKRGSLPEFMDVRHFLYKQFVGTQQLCFMFWPIHPGSKRLFFAKRGKNQRSGDSPRAGSKRPTDPKRTPREALGTRPTPKAGAPVAGRLGVLSVPTSRLPRKGIRQPQPWGLGYSPFLGVV